MEIYTDLDVPERILLGPGPSMVAPRVLGALSQPMVGHMDPKFFAVMADVQELLRYVFQTENELTLPISGTGSAGMESALCNFIEPGDTVLIGVNGFFGERLCDMAGRYGANVRRLEKPWGEIYSPDEIEAELKKESVKLVGLVHGETSTGTMQSMDGMAEVAHRHGALLLVDTVASLGGTQINVDGWDVDIAYGGSQKCLSCPPGLAPLTLGPRALETLRSRKTQVKNWYLDLTMIDRYWREQHRYHHTSPVSMNYALRESLRLIYEEGLEDCIARHRRHAGLLWAGLEEMGLEMHVPIAHRLPTLTTVRAPEGVDEAAIRRQMLERFNIEIAGGLGDLAGKIWRIGLMGYSSREENVVLVLAALKELIDAQ